MAKRMLIDAAHPEETRVVVTSGNRLEEFDFESSTKKQVKGNIYLAKVTRVEPSLQAAFVDYGGNRHGFLAFSEIHPDYYRIPVGDRRSEEYVDTGANGHDPAGHADEEAVSIAAALPEPVTVPEPLSAEEEEAEDAADAAAASTEAAAEAAAVEWQDPTESAPEAELAPEAPAESHEPAAEAQAEPEPAPPPSPEETAPQPETASWQPLETHTEVSAIEPASAPDEHRTEMPLPAEPAAEQSEPVSQDQPVSIVETMALRSADDAVIAVEVHEFAATETATPDADAPQGYAIEGEAAGGEGAEGEAHDNLPAHSHGEVHETEHAEAEIVETFGGDEVEDAEEDDAAVRRRYHSSRHYKIQEVIKRRQIMLVQVAKEERGNKGAALTTYLSLAGRYCVLMPNTNRGGGVSRKITSIADRRRLKDILEDLEIPEGMGVIVRTAGAERSKAEIKRDYEYLLRLWNEIRDLTLQSTAPALIYEEGNLIKRSIRDLYTRDIEDVLVEGEEGYKIAKGFMRTLMPSHAKRVQPYRDPQVGLFHRFQIESQIDAVHSPVAQLRSGGYLVINQTEALVAIDVNSGRSTRERNIEETALRTNLEAADEIGRQLRLRDLAGLIVIDFIDMEEHRNQIAVERRLKEALRNDRARIQVGRISPFGLMEMSRQRLRPSLAEASTQPCPHCAGTGFIRSVESTALYVLRSIEEEGIRRRSAEICVYVPTNVALYILNQKRDSLAQIEERYAMRVRIERDDTLIPPNYRLERLRQYGLGEAPPLPTIQAPTLPEEPEDEEDEAVEAADEAVENGAEAESEEDRGRRRRRRRRRRPDEGREARPNGDASEGEEAAGEPAEAVATDEDRNGGRDGDGERRPRRRGRRGRVRTPRRDDAAAASAEGPDGDTVSEHDFAEPADAAGAEFAAEMPAASAYEPAVQAWEVFPLPTPPAVDEPRVEAPSYTALTGETIEPLPPEQPHPQPAVEEVVPSAEAEQGVPFVSEQERVLEEATAVAETAPAPQPERKPEPVMAEPALQPEREPEPVMAEPAPQPVVRPNDDVQTVTEKPANPRRGWWQRLINS